LVVAEGFHALRAVELRHQSPDGLTSCGQFLFEFLDAIVAIEDELPVVR